MTITVGVTDTNWAEFLRTDQEILEANFWLPSGGAFRSLEDGEVFLFKTKAPERKLIGGGVFQGFLELRVSEAWDFFGQGNGVATEDALHEAIQHYRESNRKPYLEDPTIGCVLLRDLFFAEPGNELREPDHWASNWVTWRNYVPGSVDWEYVLRASQELAYAPRLDLAWDGPDLREEIETGPRFGKPRLVRTRLGQRTFRARVTAAYGFRCAITGSQNVHALEAAHIRPHSENGPSILSNGLLLRRDVHRLFDRGYLAIDQDFRLKVSPQLRIDTGNGVEFERRASSGEVIRLPGLKSQHPSREWLDWHMREKFLSA